MAGLYKRKRFTIITIVYWFLLTYILTALLFFVFSLLKQNSLMAEYRIMQLKKDDPQYVSQVDAIQKQQKAKVAQYVGEGVIFMLLILVGAVFVYRATRRQLQLNHQQQNFMMAVTHELKTPIAIAKLNLETLLKRRLEEAQQQKLIQNTLQEANRLHVLCDNILLASQIDSGHFKVNREVMNLSQLIRLCADNFAQRFPLWNFRQSIIEDVYIKGDTLLMELAINNLIENAVKYSPRQSTITIGLQQNNQEAALTISDEGQGIADEQKQKVFDKFYRDENENTRKTKGTGLGLYLTLHIVKDHKGSIKITDNTPTGSNFIVTLPVA